MLEKKVLKYKHYLFIKMFNDFGVYVSYFLYDYVHCHFDSEGPNIWLFFCQKGSDSWDILSQL